MPESIEFLSAVLLVSRQADNLANFYKNVVGLPLRPGAHENKPNHYSCELGDLHFAIHPTEDFKDGHYGSGAVRVCFTVFDLKVVLERLAKGGVKPIFDPEERSYGLVTAIHDPDGNYVEFVQHTEEWYGRMRERRRQGVDVLQRWEEIWLGKPVT